ncbi:hypothetical protein D3C85_1291810 [compost metagenome]
MNLDLIHIHRRTANLLNHLNAVTCTANLVGSYVSFQIWSDFSDHIRVGTETAGGHNDSCCCNSFLICLVKQDLDAVYLAVLLCNFLHICIYKQRNALLLNILHQTFDQVLAYRRAILRTVCAFFVHTAGNRNIVQTDSDRIQPVNRTCGIINEETEHFFVVGIMAAF